jgi:hypothetical protein
MRWGADRSPAPEFALLCSLLRRMLGSLCNGAWPMIEALFLLLTAAAPQAAADPLAAAKAGKLQCANPNVEKKTCFS